MNKIAIICQGGLGDNITYAARLQSLLNKENVKSADFYLYGPNIWREVLYMIIDFLMTSPIIDNVYVNRMPDSSYKNVIDWREDNSPVLYPIQKNYKAQYTSENIEWALNILEGVKNPITVHPYSLNSIANAINQKYLRSPHEDWWKQLFKDIRSAGGTPIVLGGDDERIDWQTDDVINAYVNKDNFMNNIPLLYNVKGHIGIASWTWQLTHYYGEIDTCVLWFKDNHWVNRSVSTDTSKLHIYHEIPTNKELLSKISVLKNNL